MSPTWLKIHAHSFSYYLMQRGHAHHTQILAFTRKSKQCHGIIHSQFKHSHKGKGSIARIVLQLRVRVSAICPISYANTCLRVLSYIHKIAFVGGSKTAEGGQQYVTFHKRSNCEDGLKVTRDNLCSLFHHMAL